MEVSDADIAARMAKWKAPEPRYKRGVFAKYAAWFLPLRREQSHLCSRDLRAGV